MEGTRGARKLLICIVFTCYVRTSPCYEQRDRLIFLRLLVVDAKTWLFTLYLLECSNHFSSIALYIPAAAQVITILPASLNILGHDP